ncbi:MAG TPA: hypothetical protein DCL21_05730 [Alphaproteobacteria bacterium]|nr:hypothetical protein [Alphaproteobacteria bacterium]
MCVIKTIEIDERLISQEIQESQQLQSDVLEILREEIPMDTTPMGFAEFNFLIERENKRLEKALLDDYYTNLQTTN